MEAVCPIVALVCSHDRQPGLPNHRGTKELTIGRFIHCARARLHCIGRGCRRSPCVVLLHGNGSMRQGLGSWTALLPKDIRAARPSRRSTELWTLSGVGPARIKEDAMSLGKGMRLRRLGVSDY
jgi:hypothetical protein